MIRISVIVVAHKRRNYIMNALFSLSNQTLDREEYEVIVVKNFSDEYIDNYISRHGYKEILSHSLDLTGKLLEGVMASSGDIITILEDDDRYVCSRLEKVVDAFALKELVFYHNSFIMINEDEQYIIKNRQERTFTFNINDNEVISHFRDAIYFRCHHNLSSMALKRDFFAKLLEIYHGTTYAVDLLLFIKATSTRGNLLMDSNKLTFYMQHESASTIYSKEEANEASYTSRDLMTVDLLRHLLNEESNPFLRRRVDLLITERSIYLKLKNSKNFNGDVTLRQFFSFLYEKLHRFEPEAYFISLLFIVSRIFPSTVSKVAIKISKFRLGKGI